MRILTRRVLVSPGRLPLSTTATVSSQARYPVRGTLGQAVPLGPYYDAILRDPTPHSSDKKEPPSSTTETDTQEAGNPKGTGGRKPREDKPSLLSTLTRKHKTPTETSTTAVPSLSPEAQARVVFGSRLAGPAERAERLAEMQSRSSLVAGVLVPPRPDEPDNCCMSGCVNCVWDRYRDEMELWASAHAEAERRLRARDASVSSTAAASPPVGVGYVPPPSSLHSVGIDDDGGGSETNWEDTVGHDDKIAKDFWDDELYKNLPVGIREFMKQEKRLKLKHKREGTSSG